MQKNMDLKRRIVEISYEKKLSHIGSCLSSVDIIDEIYAKKKADESFILSNGHAGLALYCVIEKYERKNASDIFLYHGVHPDRCLQCHIYASSGSLGHGIGIALGMALTDRKRHVYCLVSDGECAEGSVWEAFRIQREQGAKNLHVFVSINGYGAYRKINGMQLAHEIEFMSMAKPVFTSLLGYPKWLTTQEAHYGIMDKRRYDELMEFLQ